MSKENKVYQKYIIQKTDGTPVDPKAKYFVLRIDQQDKWGQVCRRALRQLARDVHAMIGNEELSKELYAYADENTDYLIPNTKNG